MPETRLGQTALRHDRWVVLALGATMATGLAPFGLGPIAFAALAGILWLGDKAAQSAPARPLRRAFALGWCAGLGYFGLGLHWIVEPFFVDAATTGWMAPFGLAGMAGGLALFWGAAFWAAERLGGGVWQRAIALALAETARGFVFTGFPWALVSHIWSGTAVLHWGALIGPYGLTLLTLLMAALPLWAWARLRNPALTLGLGFAGWGALLGIGLALAARPAPAPGPDAPVLRLVQPNAQQHEKWDPEKIPFFFNRMVSYSQATDAAGTRPDLVLWPESALTVLLEEAEPALAYIAQNARTQTLIGVQRRSETPGAYHNALALMDTDGVPQQLYDKHHLVPFGEYMPAPGLWQRLGIAALAQRTEFGYAPGPGGGAQILDIPEVGRALPMICYEAVFARHARVSGDRPDFLLQLTNDAWFGAAVGPWQHLEQARMRAIEQGLPLVRVANTGVSGLIDARGRLAAQLGRDRAGYLDVALPPPAAPTLYARTGDAPAFAVLALLAALAAAAGLVRARKAH
jgi:apolipoprotein N-acyltransferase